MKGLPLVLTCLVTAAWCNLGLAQEVRQGVPVKPSSIYTFETFDPATKKVTETSEQTILSVNGARARVQEVRSTGRTFTRTLDLSSHSMPWSHAQGVYAFIRFPCAVGETWDWTASELLNGERDRNARMTWKMSARFVGWEDIVVPAGNFRAAKIEHTGFWSRNTDGGGARLEVTVWYAPDVGRFVKRSEIWWGANKWDAIEESEVRLAKYQLAPDSVVGPAKTD